MVEKILKIFMYRKTFGFVKTFINDICKIIHLPKIKHLLKYEGKQTLKNIIQSLKQWPKFLWFSQKTAKKKSKPTLAYILWERSQGYVIECLRNDGLFDITEVNLVRIFRDMIPKELQTKAIMESAMRGEVARIACQNKELYINRIKKAISADGIDCLISTADWTPPLRYVVEAFRQSGIPTICILHEGVFAKANQWFMHVSDDGNVLYDKPLADKTFVWGKLQKQIFVERGYPEDKIIATGSPKFDEYFDYKPAFDRAEFCRRYRFDPNKKIILYVVQPFDIQFDTELGLRKQARAILDILKVAGTHGFQALIRMYQSRSVDILGEDFKSRAAPYSGIYFIDGKQETSPRLTKPIESIYFSDLITSFNSTMLMEAAILQKPSLSIQYLDFECLWTKFGGMPSAKDEHELEENIVKYIDYNSTTFTEAGYQWMIDNFHGEGIDGKATQRIAAEILKAIRQFHDDKHTLVGLSKYGRNQDIEI